LKACGGTSEVKHASTSAGLNKRDAADQTRRLRPLRGVLERPMPGEFEHRRIAPPAELADRIEHFWYVRWKRPPDSAHTVRTLPHPCVHWTFESQGARLSGVHRSCWSRALEPQGEVFGIKFLPAGFCAQWPQPMHRLVDQVLDAEAQAPLEFAKAVRASVFSAALPDAGDARIEAALQVLRDCLLPALAAVDPLAAEVNAAVFAAAEDRELLRAERWAARLGLSLRSWQRVLRETVGVSPKWILSRYRLQDALHRLQGGEAEDLAELAADYGYADAAHFSRDYRRMLGLAPSGIRAMARGALGAPNAST